MYLRSLEPEFNNMHPLNQTFGDHDHLSDPDLVPLFRFCSKLQHLLTLVVHEVPGGNCRQWIPCGERGRDIVDLHFSSFWNLQQWYPSSLTIWSNYNLRLHIWNVWSPTTPTDHWGFTTTHKSPRFQWNPKPKTQNSHRSSLHPLLGSSWVPPFQINHLCHCLVYGASAWFWPDVKSWEAPKTSNTNSSCSIMLPKGYHSHQSCRSALFDIHFHQGCT